MKTNISSDSGVVTERTGNGVYVEGLPHYEAPFAGRWVDHKGDVSEGPGQLSLTFEGYRDTGFFMRFFRHDQNDALFMVYQMPHQWATTTAVRPHMHCIPMASGSGAAVFNYVLAWADFGDVFPAAVGWTSGSVSASWTPADQYKHKVISFGDVTPHADAGASGMLVFKIERNSALDTYATSKDHGTGNANVAILDLDLHLQLNRAGTVGEFA